MTTETDTVDVPEAGAILKVHPKTVLELIAEGALPAARIGRAYVMMRRDVVNHAQQQIARQTAQRMRGKAGAARQRATAL